MKHLSFSLCLLAATATHAAFAQSQQWQKAELDSLTTVEFPAAPVKQQVQGQQVLVVNDNGTLYMLMRQPNAFKLNPDADELAKFYGGVEEGILQQAGDGEVIKRSAFQLNGFRGEEIQFSTPSKPELPSAKFVRVVLINNSIYIQNYWASAEQAANPASRQHFFNSLQTTAQPVSATDARRSGTPYRLGYIVGQLGFIALLIGGGVLLVRALRKPKRMA